MAIPALANRGKTSHLSYGNVSTLGSGFWKLCTAAAAGPPRHFAEWHFTNCYSLFTLDSQFSKQKQGSKIMPNF
jgi:hypothetical protein